MRHDRSFRASGYHSAFLTSFSFDPMVFENVVLLNLRRGKCRNISVLVDGRMARQSISEMGAPKLAGLDYHLAQKEVPGAFHPKITIQLGQKSGRLMVGSGNLTTSGLAGNLETLSDLKFGGDDLEASPLVAAALKYFEAQVDPSDRAMMQSLQRARAQSPWLKSVSAQNTLTLQSGERIGFLTDTDDSGVGDKFVDFIGEDEISNLIVMSPFWDRDLAGVKEIYEKLGNPELKIVPDLRFQEFDRESLNSFGSVELCSPEPLGVHRERRPMHAKVIVAEGRNHDYVLSGSMNASIPGLFGKGSRGGNSEAAIARTVPFGEAIELLGLEQVLQKTLRYSDLKPKPNRTQDKEDLTSFYPGAFEISGGQMAFVAAPRVRATSIDVFDRVEVKLATFDCLDGIRTRVTLPAEMTSAPRYAAVVNESGERSCLVPIISLADLDHASRPSASNRDLTILRELERSGRVSDEVLELLERMGGLRRPVDLSAKRLGPTGGSSPVSDDGEIETHLTKEEIDRLMRENDEEKALREIGTLDEIRRSMNRTLEIVRAQEDQGTSEERIAQIDLHVSDADLEEAKGHPPEEEKNLTNDGIEQKPQDKPIISTSERQNSIKIEERLAKTGDALVGLFELLEPGNLPIGQALVLRAFIMATLGAAAKSSASERYPIPPLTNKAKQPGGWVRLTGRILSEYLKQWSAPEFLMREHKDYELEAFALLINAGSLWMECARRSGIDEAVVLVFQQTYSSYAKALEKSAKMRESDRIYIETCTSRYAAQEDFVRLTGV
ncbi:MAG: hypothetical protein JXR15_00840 [Shimia sp.]|uniref:hypothetical protein n=1 Tax=Shimia sp. TaxID=1954381 RepID=UPI003B8C786C